MIRRQPRPELLPFVARLWASDAEPAAGGRELVVPTGAMHVVIRLDEPLRVFDRIDGGAPRTIGCAVIGGARAEPYIRDVSRRVRSVGAQLRPGAAALLLGASGRALAGRHSLLDEVWGRAGDELCEQLAEAGCAGARLDRFEAALLARLPRVRGVHPAVAHALGRFAIAGDVAAVVDEVGYSHRRFIELFDDAVGLSPKRYCRVQRLQRAISSLGGRSASGGALAAIAAAAGYADQAHFTREFRALVGVAPGEYRARIGAHPNHVPLASR